MFLENLYLVPLLPAFGATLMFFFGRKLEKRTVSVVCVGTVALAFIISCGAVYEYTHTHAGSQAYEKIMYTWLGSDTGHLTYSTKDGYPADFKAQVGFLLDPLSSIWLLFVTGVGMLIHIYSTGYMAHEGGYYRFFGYLNLFMFSMLTLILANNYALLFVGACGKSAQLPLYVWLPDAMEGPTPVSALIHAATMVTAGVYMVARSNAIFVLAPHAMKTVAIVGALTAIFAASIGLVQNDIKRVLAYSTVSQLGYMFLALGVGAFAAGVFHVFTHAFFKALLFLGAGSVIHAMSGEQDMRNMGDLAHRTPVTHITMFIATLAIAGIPPFAGFFSKDEILWQTWTSEHGAYIWLWVIGYGTALMTAFYMFRLMYLTFHGHPRMSHEVEHHIHESPRSMTVPLMILAFCSIFAGWLGWPHSLGGSDNFAKFLAPVFAEEAVVLQEGGKAGQLAAAEKEEEHTSSTEYGLMILSVGAGVVGWGLAWKFYRHANKGYTEPIEATAKPLYTTLYNKWYVDELYAYLFTGRRKTGNVRLGVLGLGDASAWFDVHIVDGAVNGTGWGTRIVASISKWFDTWIIDGVGVNGPAILARILSYPFRLFEWGQVQWYALVMVAGLLGFIFYYAYR